MCTWAFVRIVYCAAGWCWLPTLEGLFLLCACGLNSIWTPSTDLSLLKIQDFSYFHLHFKRFNICHIKGPRTQVQSIININLPIQIFEYFIYILWGNKLYPQTLPIISFSADGKLGSYWVKHDIIEVHTGKCKLKCSTNMTHKPVFFVYAALSQNVSKCTPGVK